MAERLFKAMGRERREMVWYPGHEATLKMVECEKCGGMITEGDWPWCRGNPEDHVR